MLVNEEVADKTVRLAISTTKLTGRTLCRALSMYLRHCKQKKALKDDHIKGKQTVKELIGQNQGVSSLPVGETGIKDFERIAKKYGVDFAIVKDKTVTKQRQLQVVPMLLVPVPRSFDTPVAVAQLQRIV